MTHHHHGASSTGKIGKALAQSTIMNTPISRWSLPPLEEDKMDDSKGSTFRPMLLDPMFSPSASIDAVSPTLGLKEGRQTRLRRRESYKTIRANERGPNMVQIEHIMRINGHEVTVKNMKKKSPPKKRESIQEIFKNSNKKAKAKLKAQRKAALQQQQQEMQGIQMALEHRRSATPLAKTVPKPIRISTPPSEVGLMEDSTEFKVVRNYTM